MLQGIKLTKTFKTKLLNYFFITNLYVGYINIWFPFASINGNRRSRYSLRIYMFSGRNAIDIQLP